MPLMSLTPLTWHYGLVAKWWAEFSEDGPEIAYFQRYVERGQPALDVACGPRVPLAESERRRGSDGAEYALESRLLDLDPIEQFATYEMRAGIWRSGELVQEEEHALRINFYFKNELLLLLERAGFIDIVVHGDHREEAATRDSDFVVFIAKRP
jgi:hypothetical protein